MYSSEPVRKEAACIVSHLCPCKALHLSIKLRAGFILTPSGGNSLVIGISRDHWDHLLDHWCCTGRAGKIKPSQNQYKAKSLSISY